MPASTKSGASRFWVDSRGGPREPLSRRVEARGGFRWLTPTGYDLASLRDSAEGADGTAVGSAVLVPPFGVGTPGEKAVPAWSPRNALPWVEWASRPLCRASRLA